MRLAVCVAILGEMPELRDRHCLQPEKELAEEPETPHAGTPHGGLVPAPAPHAKINPTG